MKTIRLFLLFILPLLVYNCEDFLSCIIPREPELQNKEFPIGTTEAYYYVEVKAEINNEPFDDD